MQNFAVSFLFCKSSGDCSIAEDGKIRKSEDYKDVTVIRKQHNKLGLLRKITHTEYIYLKDFDF